MEVDCTLKPASALKSLKFSYPGYPGTRVTTFTRVQFRNCLAPNAPLNTPHKLESGLGHRGSKTPITMSTTMLEGGTSDYEKMRAENMKRNQEIMKQLGTCLAYRQDCACLNADVGSWAVAGLDQTDFRLHEAHKATKKGNGKQKGAAPASKKRKLEEEDSEKVTPQRRSSRQKGLPASEIKAEVLPDDDEDGVSAEVRKLRDLRGSEEGHALAEAEHLRWAGRQGKQTIVGTASYQHTLHRVMTMNEAALGRRINAIERARGKVATPRQHACSPCKISAIFLLTAWLCFQFAVVKMRLFARVLCLEGYQELSEDAAGALSRLIAVLGEPEGEDEVVDAVECVDAED
eukprot:3339821-Rhodomonas_salina.1